MRAGVFPRPALKRHAILLRPRRRTPPTECTEVSWRLVTRIASSSALICCCPRQTALSVCPRRGEMKQTRRPRTRGGCPTWPVPGSRKTVENGQRRQGHGLNAKRSWVWRQIKIWRLPPSLAKCGRERARLISHILQCLRVSHVKLHIIKPN